MSDLVYKRVPKSEIPPKVEIDQTLLDFILFYEETNPEFVKMFGKVIDFYCKETNSFQISEINSEYQYFLKK